MTFLEIPPPKKNHKEEVFFLIQISSILCDTVPTECEAYGDKGLKRPACGDGCCLFPGADWMP